MGDMPRAGSATGRHPCLPTMNVVFSDEDKILIKHIPVNTLSIHNYTRTGIKIGALERNLFAFSSISAEYLQKI